MTQKVADVNVSQHFWTLIHIHDGWLRTLPTPHSVITSDVISKPRQVLTCSCRGVGGVTWLKCLAGSASRGCHRNRLDVQLYSFCAQEGRESDRFFFKLNLHFQLLGKNVVMCHDLLLSFLFIVSWHETRQRGGDLHSTAACFLFQFHTDSRGHKHHQFELRQ